MLLFQVAAHKKIENVVGDADDARADGLDPCDPDAGPVLCPRNADAGPEARRSHGRSHGQKGAIGVWRNRYWRVSTRPFTAECSGLLGCLFSRGMLQRMRYRGATHYFLVCIHSPGAVLPFSGYLMSPEECRAKGFPPGSVMLDDDDERPKQPQPQRHVTTSGAPPQRSVTTSGGQPQTQVSWVYLCASVSCVLVSSAAGVRVANRYSATVTWWPRMVVRFDTHATLVQKTEGPISRASIGASFIQRGGKVQCPQLSVLASAFPMREGMSYVAVPVPPPLPCVPVPFPPPLPRPNLLSAIRVRAKC